MRNLSDITANMNVHAVLLWEASFHHFSLKKFAYYSMLLYRTYHFQRKFLETSSAIIIF